MCDQTLKNRSFVRFVPGRAVKVFRTKDLCGQTYLAYHIDSISQLRLVRYSSSNDQAHYIFGAVTQMQAKDAIQLEVNYICNIWLPKTILYFQA